MKGGFSKATSLQKEMSQASIKELKSLILSHILRRTKKQLRFQCKLPERKEYIVFCPMTNSQMQIYEIYVTYCLKVFNKWQVQDHTRKSGTLLEIISNLRKIVNHPYLFFQFH